MNIVPTPEEREPVMTCVCGHDMDIHPRGECRMSGCACARHGSAFFVADCEGATTAEEVGGLIEWYREMDGNSAGGSLHVVVEDGNTARSNVESCRDYARERGDTCGVALAEALLRLAPAEYIEVLGEEAI